MAAEDDCDDLLAARLEAECSLTPTNHNKKVTLVTLHTKAAKSEFLKDHAVLALDCEGVDALEGMASCASSL